MDTTVNYHNTSDSLGDNAKVGKPRIQDNTEAKTGLIKNVVIVNSICLIICSSFALVTKRDGSWSPWESWGTCSTTCNGGLRSRTRTCTYPVPSVLGEYCYGNPNEIELCNFVPCSDTTHGQHLGRTEESGSVRSETELQIHDLNSTLNKVSAELDRAKKELTRFNETVSKLNYSLLIDKIDGKWTAWETWSSCSVTCGTGIRSRLRNCTNPRPSLKGNFCDGPPIQVDVCRNQACADTKVAFTAYGMAGSAYGINAVRFPTVIENHGGGYKSETGTFTCTTAGLYHFVATLSVIQKPGGDGLLCNIYINNLEKVALYVYKKPSSDETYPATAAGTFHLNKDDVVYIGGCSSYISDIHNDEGTSFTGVLITPDI